MATKIKCVNCDHEVVVLHNQQHHYTSSGLSNVFLEGIDIRECGNCGEREIVIPRIEELHRVLAHALIVKRAPLTAAEFKFLRKHLGWASQDLAHKFGVDPSTVSRWEKETEPLSRWADRLIRLSVAQFSPVEDYSSEDLDLIDSTVGSMPRMLRVRRERGGWRDVRSQAA